jgi:type IV fimbrial biogenesis protein FimT
MNPVGTSPRWAAAAVRSCRGITLIELMVALAVLGVLLMLAAPTMRDFISTQRHKAVHAEMASDLQFARGEAVARADWLFLQFGKRANGSTCYTLFTCTAATAGANNPVGCECDCAALPCAGATQELRTVVVDIARDLTVQPVAPGAMSVRLRFDPRTGGLRVIGSNVAGAALPTDDIDIETLETHRSRALRARVSGAGRVSLCAPGGVVSGYDPC